MKLATKEKREQDIVKALGAYDEEVHPVGEKLPTNLRVFRVRVVCTFLKAGVPLNKIYEFRVFSKKVVVIGWLEDVQ